MKKIIAFLLILLFLSIPNLYAYEAFQTYEDNILFGKVLIFYFPPDAIVKMEKDLFYATFTITNISRSPINLNKVGYRVVKRDGLIYKLENPIMIYNEGIYDSYTLNPNHKAEVRCETPFTKYSEADNIQEIYIKIGDKRVFFVRYDDVEEYSKIENRILRHLRNLWWNIR
jgi:hypothetical protein